VSERVEITFEHENISPDCQDAEDEIKELTEQLAVVNAATAAAEERVAALERSYERLERDSRLNADAAIAYRDERDALQAKLAAAEEEQKSAEYKMLDAEAAAIKALIAALAKDRDEWREYAGEGWRSRDETVEQVEQQAATIRALREWIERADPMFTELLNAFCAAEKNVRQQVGPGIFMCPICDQCGKGEIDHAPDCPFGVKLNPPPMSARALLAPPAAEGGAGEHSYMECAPGSCLVPVPFVSEDHGMCHWPYGNGPYTGGPFCPLPESGHLSTDHANDPVQELTEEDLKPATHDPAMPVTEANGG
jgi:hypothetical protein